MSGLMSQIHVIVRKRKSRNPKTQDPMVEEKGKQKVVNLTILNHITESTPRKSKFNHRHCTLTWKRNTLMRYDGNDITCVESALWDMHPIDTGKPHHLQFTAHKVFPKNE